MTLRVWLYPEPGEKVDAPSSGILRIIGAQHRHLPNYGIELVSSSKGADIRAVHINPPKGAEVDVLHSHGLYPTAEMELPKWADEVNARVIDAALRAKVVTVPSPWVAEIFQRNMGFSPVIVSHGIEQSEWPEPPEERAPMVLWNKGRPGDVCSPMSLNRLALMRTNIPFISTFGHATSNVAIAGTLPFAAMKKLLYGCGIYFAPTKETWGIGIVEAMAAGLPVLTWNWGHNPSLLEHQVHGYIAEPGDYADTARGLDYCIKHRQRLGKAAREHAMSPRFSWDRAMELYAKVYRLAAQQRAPSPVVSVIIPCYNYAPYVAKAIQSVQQQTFKDFECIIVDDGSTDDSLRVIKETIKDDSRFRVITQENAKVAAARNRGALESSGQFLCFLDADDAMKPRCLELLLGPVRRDSTIGISYGGLETTTSKGQVSAWPDAPNFAQQLQHRNQVPTCCLVSRRAFFRAGGFKKHAIPAEDAELWTNIGLVGYKFVQATKESTFIYRMHDDSATADLAVRGGNEQEPDWLAWIPAANGGVQPIASVAPKAERSHPVRNYDKPLVSFVTPVGEAHQDVLFDAIESVVAQVDPRWELIVIDDTNAGQLQDYGVIPYRVRYPFVRWLRNSHLHNVSAARNMGARIARGRFLCFLDADDILHKRFLAETLPTAAQHPGGIVYTDWIELPEIQMHQAEEWDVNQLLDHALFAITFLHPTRAFQEVGGFDENLDIWEDWDYTVRLTLLGYWGTRVPHPLFGYRYNTGRRREDSLKAAEKRIPEMQARYKGTRPLPPRGDAPVFKVVAHAGPVPLPRGTARARRRDPAISPQEQRAALLERFKDFSDDMVLIEYIGRGAGGTLYKAPSGLKYRFGPGRHSLKPVAKDDAEYFLGKTTQFRAVEA